MKYKLQRQKAFTLIEVLVALAILTIGIGAVIKVSASQASQLAYLKDKTIAQWVASNKVNEIQIDSWPSIGTSTGQETMANQDWDWKVKVSKTADKDLRRIDVEIRHADEDGEPLVSYVAFSGNRKK